MLRVCPYKLEIAAKAFASIEVSDCIFINSGSICFERAVKRMLIKPSRHMMADVSKLETTMLYSVASLSVIKYLITDASIDPKWCAEYEKPCLKVL